MADRQAFEEEPFEGEFPFEKDFEGFGPDEDLESLFEFEEDLDPLGFEAEEGELSDAKVRRAVRLNPRWARRLRWQARRDDIVRLLGFTDMSPDEATFAQAVARWQGSRRLTADGIIGPNTWRRMRAQLGVRLSAAAVRRAVRLNPRWARRLGWQARRDDIVRLLGFTDMSPDEATFAQAVARWQGSRRLTADGIIGPRTWRRMRAQLGRLPTPVAPPPVRPGVQLIRKNEARMSDAEKGRFRAAFTAVIRNGTFGHFVQNHAGATGQFEYRNHFFAGSFGEMRFLPWHRAYLVNLERALRAVDPSAFIPYWHWTVSRAIPDWLRDFRPPVPMPDGTRLQVRRDQASWPLPTEEQVNAELSNTTFAAFTRALERGSHGAVHVWVGGNMKDAVIASSDVLFWLHHCEIDRLWNVWQRTHAERPTLPERERIMDPYTETVEQLLDITALGYEYADPVPIR